VITGIGGTLSRERNHRCLDNCVTVQLFAYFAALDVNEITPRINGMIKKPKSEDS